MKSVDKNKKVKTKGDHLQIELTATAPDHNQANEQQHILRKDAKTQTKRIKSKNVRVQTEEMVSTFDNECTNDRKHPLDKDIEIKNNSLHKVQVMVPISDANEVPDTSIKKNRRVVEADPEKQNLRIKKIINNMKPDMDPIIGYAEEPLLPLYKACAPLIPIIHNLSFYVELALDETPEHPPDGLTIDESAAIRLYTLEWEGDHRSLYSMLNHTLKKDTRENLRPYHKYLKLFLTAIVKLPCVPHLTIWRGITKDMSSDFLPGTQVTWWGFSSCTTEMQVLESNIYLGTSGNRTLFSVEAINGRTIRDHSHFVTEDEILLLPGTHMIVQSKFSPAPDLHIVHLRQVEPEQLLLQSPFENAHIYPKTKRHWYRKKRFGIPICLFTVLIIAGIILGSALGTRLKNNTPQNKCQTPFGTATTFRTGNNPTSVTSSHGIGNKLMVAIANSGDNTIGILLSNENGTFQAPKRYAVGRMPYSMVLDDFNNDRLIDLAVVNAGDNTVSVLLANGNGTFAISGNYTVGRFPRSLVCDNFNMDQSRDLAVVNTNDSTVSILLGNSDGTFNISGTIMVGRTPYSVASGNLNNDHSIDLAVANYADNTVSILLGYGNGTFQTPKNINVGNGPTYVLSTNFINDVNMDLLVTNYNDNTVYVLMGMGNGSFQISGNYTVGLGPYSMVLADFNNDNHADLAVANRANNTISILINNKNASFQSPISYKVGSEPSSVISDTFTSDNLQDLLVTNEGSSDASIFLNECTTM